MIFIDLDNKNESPFNSILSPFHVGFKRRMYFLWQPETIWFSLTRCGICPNIFLWNMPENLTYILRGNTLATVVQKEIQRLIWCSEAKLLYKYIYILPALTVKLPSCMERKWVQFSDLIHSRFSRSFWASLASLFRPMIDGSWPSRYTRKNAKELLQPVAPTGLIQVWYHSCIRLLSPTNCSELTVSDWNSMLGCQGCISLM